jgi:hypothetical protein
MQARVETSLLGITPRGLDASGTLHLAILSEQVWVIGTGAFLSEEFSDERIFASSL